MNRLTLFLLGAALLMCSCVQEAPEINFQVSYSSDYSELVAAIRDQTTTLEQKFDLLNKALQDNTLSLEQKLEAMNKTLESVNESLTSLSSLQEIATSLSTMMTVLEALATSTEYLKDLSSIKEAISSMEKIFETIRETVVGKEGQEGVLEALFKISATLEGIGTIQEGGNSYSIAALLLTLKNLMADVGIKITLDGTLIEKYLESMSQSLESISAMVDKLSASDIQKLIVDSITEGLESITTSLEKISDNTSTGFLTYLESIKESLEKVAETGTSVDMSKVEEALALIAGRLVSTVGGVDTNVGEWLAEIAYNMSVLNTISGTLESIGSNIDNFAKAALEYFTAITTEGIKLNLSGSNLESYLKAISESLTTVTNLVEGLSDVDIQNMVKAITDGLTNISNKVDVLVNTESEGLLDYLKAISEAMASITTGGISVDLSGVESALALIAGRLITSVDGVDTNIAELLSAHTTWIGYVLGQLNEIMGKIQGDTSNISKYAKYLENLAKLAKLDGVVENLTTVNKLLGELHTLVENNGSTLEEIKAAVINIKTATALLQDYTTVLTNIDTNTGEIKTALGTLSGLAETMSGKLTQIAGENDKSLDDVIAAMDSVKTQCEYINNKLTADGMVLEALTVDEWNALKDTMTDYEMVLGPSLVRFRAGDRYIKYVSTHDDVVTVAYTYNAGEADLYYLMLGGDFCYRVTNEGFTIAQELARLYQLIAALSS